MVFVIWDFHLHINSYFYYQIFEIYIIIFSDQGLHFLFSGGALRGPRGWHKGSWRGPGFRERVKCGSKTNPHGAPSEAVGIQGRTNHSALNPGVPQGLYGEMARWVILTVYLSVLTVCVQNTVPEETAEEGQKFDTDNNSREILKLSDRYDRRLHEVERRLIRKMNTGPSVELDRLKNLENDVKNLRSQLDASLSTQRHQGQLIMSFQEHLTHQKHELHRLKTSEERLTKTVDNLSLLVQELIEDRDRTSTSTATGTPPPTTINPTGEPPFTPIFPTGKTIFIKTYRSLPW